MREESRQNGKQETTCLARAGLRTSHQIATGADDWNRVLLHWRRCGITRQSDIRNQVLVYRWVREFGNGLGYITSCCLDGNVAIFVKINARALVHAIIRHTKQLTLQTLVHWANNVLVVPP